MKCMQCGYQTMSITYFIEHSYTHVAEQYEIERQIKALEEKKAKLEEKADYFNPRALVMMGPSCIYYDAMKEIGKINAEIERLKR